VRLGGVAKALLTTAGPPPAPGRAGTETFLARIARTARAAGVVEIVVVVGPPFERSVGDAALGLGLRVVRNPEPARGMASSVAVGYEAIARAPVDAAWLWPVDHPFVAATTLERLAAALGAHELAKPRFEGRSGHPPLVARARFDALAASESEAGGARAVLARTRRTIVVDVDDPGVVSDVDERG